VKPSTAPTGASAQAARAAAQQALSLTVARNWTALYALFTSDVGKTTSQAQFIQLMSAPGSPEFLEATLDGPGQSKVVGSYTYYSQPVTLTVRQTNGTTSTMHSSEYLILEQGAWKLLSTDTPE
jgi:hypothetical protein